MYIPEIIFSNLEQDYVVVNALYDSKWQEVYLESS